MQKSLKTKFNNKSAKNQPGKGREIVCPYNNMVDCFEGEKSRCTVCGWNPQVSMMRAYVIHKKLEGKK